MTQIIRTEQHRRGFFGWVFKLAFIGFNILMVAWLFSALAGIGGLHPTSDAEKAGAAIGAVAGMGMLLFFWAAGTIVLGCLVLLTRGKKVIVEQMV